MNYLRSVFAKKIIVVLLAILCVTPTLVGSFGFAADISNHDNEAIQPTIVGNTDKSLNHGLYALNNEKEQSLTQSVYSAPPSVPIITAPREVVIQEFKVKSLDDSNIYGTFSITNQSNNIYPDLTYATELYLSENQPGNNSQNLHLISQNTTKFSMNKMEIKKFDFTHEIAMNLYNGKYLFTLTVYSSLGIPMVFSSWDLGQIGKVGTFVFFNPLNSSLTDNGTKVSPLSGPNKKPGESPVLTMHMINKSFQKVAGKISCKVYNRNTIFCPMPLKEVELGEISLEALQEKSVDLNLPAMENPDSYYVLIVLKDENGKLISNCMEARYVVIGASSKIMDMSITKKNGGQAEVTANIVGSADGINFSGAKIVNKVEQTPGGTIIFSQEQTINVESYPKPVTFSFPLTGVSGDLNISVEIKYKEKTLDLRSEKFSVQEIMRDAKPISVEGSTYNSNEDVTFPDIVGTSFEKEIKYLVKKKVLNGYPDNTFKPNNPIKRDEFVIIMCKLLNESEDSSTEEISQIFNDLTDIDWAKGYISKAYSLGLFKGYPDKHYLNRKKIYLLSKHYSVFLKFINGKAFDGSRLSWPQGFVDEARKAGLTKDVVLDSRQDITRANVAKIAFEALNISGK